MKYCVVVLQHGSHGTHTDTSCVARYLQALENPPIVWEPRVNEGFLTDSGVVVCGERFAREIIRMLNTLCSSSSSSSSLLSTKSPETHNSDDDKIEKKETEEIIVQLSFIAHSMGGLIVRAALPQIFQEIEKINIQWNLKVEWKLFCAIATPHGGTCQMDAFIRSYLGRFIGRIYSTAYHDLFLQSNILTERLLSTEHLTCLAAFERRLLISSINDLLVPLVSSGFMLRPSQRYGKDSNICKDRETKMCAHCEEEIYTKQYHITNIDEKEWPYDICPVERRVAEIILKGAGAFDSVVVDFRPLANYSNNSHIHYIAYKRSHRALVCKEPMLQMGLDQFFGFVSSAVTRFIATCYR